MDTRPLPLKDQVPSTPAPNRSVRGFTLLDITVLMVVTGITLAIAIPSTTLLLSEQRRTETERELAAIEHATVGNPGVQQYGIRADFGYVGDVGAFPSNVTDLIRNPGGLPSWDGPYLAVEYVEDSLDAARDGWGLAYAFSGSLEILSVGGDTTTRTIPGDPADYLQNVVAGRVHDSRDSLPGPVKNDSVSLQLVYPAGGSGLVTATIQPDSLGQFQFSLIPAGVRLVRCIYLPTNDTIVRTITVLPRNSSGSSVEFRFTSDYFSGDGS